MGSRLTRGACEGIVLYATVTGKLPFKEHQAHRMLHLMHHGPTFRPGMSPAAGTRSGACCSFARVRAWACSRWPRTATHALSGTTLRMPPEAS
ncbi:testis-specific serine/threonine-protein kinase 5-like isoform X2 [Prionailurus iriomotensis]